MDLASVLGTILGISAVVGGQVLEGGHISQIMQGTAALIVFGGTFGAMLVSFPTSDVKRAFGLLPLVYKNVEQDVRPVIDEIIRIATIARKEGVLAVEGQRESIQNPLFKKSIKYVIDGFEPNTVKEIIDTEIYLTFEEEEMAGKVWEGAGGYAPTIGIIGAVLGLIHVMSMLNDPSKIGEGIAVAFVATVYGVGLANLWMIPWGTKLKRKAHQRMMAKEVVKLGVVGIQEGLNPHFLQEKLEVFVEEHLRRTDEHGEKIEMRKKHPEHVNLERWLVSYADFITLLFAFFVIMYAISQADVSKFKSVSASIRAAFAAGPVGMIDLSGHGGGSTANSFDTAEAPGGRLQNLPAGKTHTAADPDPELQEMKELLEETVSLELGVTDLADKLQMQFDSRGLIVRLAAKDFFDEGAVEVRPDLRPVLDRIGRVVGRTKRLVRIEGHTDPGEAQAGGMADGWTLSSARAAWLVKHWINRFDLDPKRLGIAGYSHYRPLSEETDEWGKAKNRRVEIIILNNLYETP